MLRSLIALLALNKDTYIFLIYVPKYSSNFRREDISLFLRLKRKLKFLRENTRNAASLSLLFEFLMQIFSSNFWKKFENWNNYRKRFRKLKTRQQERSEVKIIVSCKIYDKIYDICSCAIVLVTKTYIWLYLMHMRENIITDSEM